MYLGRGWPLGQDDLTHQARQKRSNRLLPIGLEGLPRRYRTRGRFRLEEGQLLGHGYTPSVRFERLDQPCPLGEGVH